MTVETLIDTILQKMPQTGKVQRKFISHIFTLLLSIRTRFNYQSMARVGTYNHLSYRKNFSKYFDFISFNKAIIKEHNGSELVVLFDPSYIRKSGKQTPGVNYFWSGSSGAVKWGLELSTLAIGDVENHTAMHYHSELTQYIKGEESMRQFYAKIVCKEAQELLKLSKYIVFDAFFSKKEFVHTICKEGFTLISRLQKNSFLRYRYLGEQKKQRGPKKKFGEKVDLKNLSIEHFTLMEGNDDERIYEGVVHVRHLKMWCKVVVVQTLEDKEVTRTKVYFSTDITTEGLKVYEYYKLRFQIEFLFRDAKGFLGLEQCQSRKTEALNFHFNACFSTLNIAKVTHLLDVPKEERKAFSMADIKTKYSNQFLLDKLIMAYGKDPLVEINNPIIREIYKLGTIAA
jgi:Transposase DDE domain